MTSDSKEITDDETLRIAEAALRRAGTETLEEEQKRPFWRKKRFLIPALCAAAVYFLYLRPSPCRRRRRRTFRSARRLAAKRRAIVFSLTETFKTRTSDLPTATDTESCSRRSARAPSIKRNLRTRSNGTTFQLTKRVGIGSPASGNRSVRNSISIPTPDPLFSIGATRAKRSERIRFF